MKPAGDGTVSSEMELVELFEQISDRLQAGDQVDLAELQREHPEAAEQIGQLLPAAELLAELGLAASRRESGPAAAHSGNPLPQASATGEELGVLGDFRILHELGRGGMGIVYEALSTVISSRRICSWTPITTSGSRTLALR